MLAIASAFMSSDMSVLLMISSKEASFFERTCSLFNLAEALNAPAEAELVSTASPTFSPSGVSVSAVLSASADDRSSLHPEKM